METKNQATPPSDDATISMQVRTRLFQALNERFLDEKQLAERWRLERKTIQKFRYEGGGPTYHKFGGSVRYALSDVIAYEETHKRENSCSNS